MDGSIEQLLGCVPYNVRMKGSLQKLHLTTDIRITACCVALLGLLSSVASAQRVNTIKPASPTVQGTVTIDGIVRDLNGQLLAAAEVVVDPEHRAMTNSRGEFSIPGLQPGTIEFMTRRIGYTPITSAVKVEPGLTAVHLAVKLAPISIQLGTIVVNGKRIDKNLWQTGFYKRQDKGFGLYFDDESLKHHQGSLATLIGNTPSVSVDRASNGIAVLFGRLANGVKCPLTVFVDGNYLPWATSVGLDDVVNRDDVLAIELYPRASELPAQVTGLGGKSGTGTLGSVNIQGASIGRGETFSQCGAILIWTKPLQTKR